MSRVRVDQQQAQLDNIERVRRMLADDVFENDSRRIENKPGQ
ncbi:hypothetical protein AVEN_207024-1, partial [Araneus ventricosus]